jgi:hypothetical protein
MDRARRTDARRARRHQVAGLTLALASLGACHELTLSPDRVIAVEILTAAPRVSVGDTLRLVARPLNAAGQVVSTVPVAWAVIDTGTIPFQLDASGLVTATALGAAKVQAKAESLRSDPITVTVTQ